MRLASIILFFAVLLLYGAAAYLCALMLASEERKESKAAERLRLAGLATHAVFLAALGVEYAELPLVGLWNVFSFVALALVAVHSVVEVRTRSSGSGVFVLGFAFLLQLASWPAIDQEIAVHEFLRSPIFGLHVLLAIAGYTAFTLSALYGVLYLMQFRALKARRISPFFRNLPPLDFLARMNLEGALIGVVCLTLTIGLGLLMAVRLEKPFLHDAKFVQVVVAWLLYAVLVGGHYLRGWTGRTLVRFSLVNFVLFVAALLVVQTLFESFHRFT